MLIINEAPVQRLTNEKSSLGPIRFIGESEIIFKESKKLEMLRALVTCMNVRS